MGGLRKLKRLVRYLVQVPEAELHFGATEIIESNKACVSVDVYVDSDWAGCLQTRRSTSGGLVVVGGGTVKSWSSTQGSIALSSGEAEYYAAVKGACEGLGVVSLLKDMGQEARLTVHIDSTSGKAIASRTGVGKVRHMDTRYLWLQEVKRSGKLIVKKILGTVNPADVLTKPKTLEETRKLIKGIGMELLVRK